MSEMQEVDYGPLKALIGVWAGDKGVDVAPEPDGTERNAYHETISFTAIGDVTNAESQVLTALHYRQIVRRHSDGEVFHDETGYWMWDASSGTIMHSLVIPRAVAVLAGGRHDGETSADGSVTIEVAAAIDDPDWKIIQSPFMLERAKTTEFRQKIIVGNGKMLFSETTMLEIYGRSFEHTDQNELMLQES